MTILFNQAPDLLEDFKQFLPETAAQAKAAAVRQAAEEAAILSNIRGDSGFTAGSQQGHSTPRNDQVRMPPVGNFAPTPSANRDNKRKRSDKQLQLGNVSALAAPYAADPTGRVASQQTGVVNKVRHIVI